MKTEISKPQLRIVPDRRRQRHAVDRWRMLVAGAVLGLAGIAPHAAHADNAPTSAATQPTQLKSQPSTTQPGQLIVDAPLLVADASTTPAPGASGPCDPYKNFSCMDDYLGSGVLERFINYYRLEWGEAAPPTDPNALSAEAEGWPQTPETIPPMAYTEFPTGALTSIGVTRPGTEDSPFMAAIANTWLGKTLTDNNFQVYGWFNPGFNFSTNKVKYGNAPVAYTVNPNTAELDQAVLYLDRWPDTVQTDHIDWGMRLSVIYGENYRYTNSYGIASWQYNKDNGWNGYDFPMEYVDVWVPKPFGGLVYGMEFRVGRYISIPDIEAQLAPNNIMYTHSLTYAWDNYTNTGVVDSIQVDKNNLVQIGITDGTETPLWHFNQYRPNLFVQNQVSWAASGIPGTSTWANGYDPLYPNQKYKTDPGNQPSLTLCYRWESDDGKTVFYPCLDGINKGNNGYNNIQWKGFTFYHKFNDHWHIDYESYWLTGYHIVNGANPISQYILANGGSPFSPQNIPFNSTNTVHCDRAYQLTCTANTFSSVIYINWSPDPLDNFSLRPEFYDDANGWRTGTDAPTKYFDLTLGWQHWFSPQIEVRPEISYWRSFRYPAFNNDVYNPDTATSGPLAPKYSMTEFASDIIIHF